VRTVLEQAQSKEDFSAKNQRNLRDQQTMVLNRSAVLKAKNMPT
jgi:hypothetical protein